MNNVNTMILQFPTTPHQRTTTAMPTDTMIAVVKIEVAACLTPYPPLCRGRKLHGPSDATDAVRQLVIGSEC